MTPLLPTPSPGLTLGAVSVAQARSCPVEGCERQVKTRGYCQTHYAGMWRKGLIKVNPSVEERFLAKINKEGPVYSGLGTPCWLWTGRKEAKGYARMVVNGKQVMIHRISYELYKGPIPKGLEIDHLCRMTSCANPDHLEAVTREENTRRKNLARAKDHCPHGHRYDRVHKQGYKVCSICQKTAIVAHRERKRRARSFITNSKGLA